jgi:hypothetical protein
MIPEENVAIYLQKFVVTAPSATTFSSSYASVGVVTTNSPGNRQWQFTWNGSFSSTQAFEIIYDFSQVNTYGYQIRFEGNLNGFITVDGQIYASDKYMKYIPQTQQDILDKIVRLRFKPPCREPLRNRTLYYVLNLNDTSCDTTSESYVTIYNYPCKNSLCTNTNSCPTCCGGVPNPLATNVYIYNFDPGCDNGNLTINYTETRAVTSFSYVSCNSSSNNVDSSTNYNLPSGVTATFFYQIEIDGLDNYAIKITGSDGNYYYFAYNSEYQ